MVPAEDVRLVCHVPLFGLFAGAANWWIFHIRGWLLYLYVMGPSTIPKVPVLVLVSESVGRGV